jgi:hypothetical protein
MTSRAKPAQLDQKKSGFSWGPAFLVLKMWKFVENILKKRVYFVVRIGYTNQCKKKTQNGEVEENVLAYWK